MHHPETRCQGSENRDATYSNDSELSLSLCWQAKNQHSSSKKIVVTFFCLYTVVGDKLPSSMYPGKEPHSKGGARVLTSSENLAQMNEKVRKKEETAKENARKKEEREQKRIEQQEQ